MDIENKITTTNNYLFVIGIEIPYSDDIKYLVDNFCGQVHTEIESIDRISASKQIYICGNLGSVVNLKHSVAIIEEVSTEYESLLKKNSGLVRLGQVPILVHGVGVYFRELFEGEHIFQSIESEHEFQALTESTKKVKALRKGIYLTKVEEETTQDGEEVLHYRLLRCSSNLTGPTDNFRKTDEHIIEVLNSSAATVFEEKTDLNHVLAQIYENKINTDPNTKSKETKAKIKAHSDKTKDMRADGLIAFCTFYDKINPEHLKRSSKDRYDKCYNDRVSGLTRLQFKLKKTVEDDSLVKEFNVILYPNSAFIIPLSTNRLYTHATKPSMLNVDRIPTRMGYVVRCSKAEALYKEEQVYLKEKEGLIKLEPMTDRTMVDLKTTYYEENTYENKVKYGKVHFSMNQGDYEKPIY
jgi:hypothetical protein